MDTLHRLYIADARSMSELDDGSVHFIVTSPPYWQLKDYGHDRQIGFHQSYDEYIHQLNVVWDECIRVLHPGCRIAVNIGDQFARAVVYGRYKVIPIREKIIQHFENRGVDYMGAIIWQKVTTCNTTGGASIMGSYPYPRNGIVKIDYEFILLFKKQGKAPSVSKEIKEQARLTGEEWSRYFNGHWTFPGERQDKHLAAFPVELPYRLIRMFSFPGETILDPFAGSGTSMIAAAQLARNSIGFEINSEFESIVTERFLTSEDIDLEKILLETYTALIQYKNDQNKHFDSPNTKNLSDFLPVQDTQRHRYGSRIAKEDPKSRYERQYRMKQVTGPCEIELEEGFGVKLYGILPVQGQEKESIQFLQDMLNGKKLDVRIRRESDIDKAPEADIYLFNRLFINSLLIRKGLARTDTSFPHRNRTRFLRYEKDLKAKSSITG